MVLGDAVTKLQTFVWIFNHISTVIINLIPVQSQTHQTWSNNQSQHELLHGGVSLSISLNLKHRSSSLRNSEMANIGVLSHTFYWNFCQDIEYSLLYQEHGNIKDRYIGVPLYKEFLLGKEFSRTLLITTYCRLHYKKRKRVS